MRTIHLPFAALLYQAIVALCGSAAFSQVVLIDTIVISPLDADSIEIHGQVSLEKWNPSSGAHAVITLNSSSQLAVTFLNDTTHLSSLKIVGDSENTASTLSFTSSDSQSLLIDRFELSEFRFIDSTVTEPDGLALVNFLYFRRVELRSGYISNNINRLPNLDNRSFGLLKFDTVQVITIDSMVVDSIITNGKGGFATLYGCDSFRLADSRFNSIVAVDTTIFSGGAGRGGNGSVLYTQNLLDLIINRCVFTRNVGTTGVIYAKSADTFISNSLFIGNSDIGVVTIRHDSIPGLKLISHCSFFNGSKDPVLVVIPTSIENCVMMNNRRPTFSQQGPDLGVDGVGPGGIFNLTATIVAGDCFNCTSVSTVPYHGLVADSLNRTGQLASIEVTDYIPLKDSPLVDLCAPTNLDTDLLGMPRTSGAFPDIGALEYQQTVKVVEADEPSALKVYPNPSSTHLFIEHPAGAVLTDVRLVSTGGQSHPLHSLDVSSSKALIQFPHLVPGHYILQVFLDGQAPISQQVVIMH